MTAKSALTPKKSEWATLYPTIPAWAVWAGLPQPHADEQFGDYVTRLGLDPKPLLAGLTERTLCIANQRLSSELIRQLPDHFHAYLQMRQEPWVRGR